MNLDINSLRPEDLEAFLKWAKGQREYFDGLVRRLEAMTPLNGSVHMSVTTVEDSDDEDVIYTILLKSGGWMANAEIRDEFQQMTGKAIDRISLRNVLKGGEDSLFKRQGTAKMTRWKAISS